MSNDNTAARARRNLPASDELPWIVANPLMAAAIGLLLAGGTGAIVGLALGVASLFARQIAALLAAGAVQTAHTLEPHITRLSAALMGKHAP